MPADFLRERMRPYSGQILSDGEHTLTYGAAWQLADGLARELDQPKYGVLCRSELNTGLGILACFSAGVTAVPLSLRYGQAHVDRIVRHTGLSHLLTDEDGALRVKQIAEPTPETEDLHGVSMILCTSGTTGNPKGAMITGDNLKTNLLGIERYFRIGSNDTVLISRPLYHCAVLTGEFLTSLCRGARVEFYNGDFNPVRLIQAMRKRRASVFCGTPTLLYHIAKLARRQSDTLPLTTVAVSGECMTRTVADSLRQALPDAAIYNVYGLTEASPRVSALPPEEFDTHPLSVGYPLRSVSAKVEGGELMIRGGSVMRGYYRDPAQTARTIVDGWLHTGDAADIDAGGRITVKGRLDNLIIRAGMNIYPQEIESALKADPRVVEALAYGVREGVTQRLHVKVVPNGLAKPELMALCREVLPAYEIPDAAELVDAIPRNASGKLLRPKTAVPA